MNRIPKVARGDIDALKQLYEQHKTKVYRLALSLSGDPYLAEDLTQETFLRVQERAHSYHRDGSEIAWILAIARNLTYDCLRKRGREICSDLTTEEYDSAVSANTPLQAGTVFTSDGVSGDLYFLDLLKDLKSDEKELVCLRILGELPWNEIGRITSQSSEACRKRYERILKRLRTQLNGLK